MAYPFNSRLTLGLLSSWHLYEGASPEPYAHTLLQGIRSAARDLGCNLLLACGTGPLSNVRHAEPAWGFPETNESYVPVGPWNTDGLIILPTELSPAQCQFLEELNARCFPVMYAGTSEEGVSVTIDNRGGILRAVQHLVEHGHRRIAFIAGLKHPGDSEQRLTGFREALQAFHLEEDQRLQVFGFHHLEGGHNAMKQILASAAPFTAVVASNDRSAMGAITALTEAGYQVPGDVAIVGFDDVPEAQSVKPALTTLRNPTYQLGYQSVVQIVKRIQNPAQPPCNSLIPTRLVIRYSCGCRLGEEGLELHPNQSGLADTIAEKILSEMRCLEDSFVLGSIRRLLSILDHYFPEGLSSAFETELGAVLDQTETAGDDTFIWNSAISIFLAHLNDWAAGRSSDAVQLRALFERARAEIGTRSRLQLAREQYKRAEKSGRFGLLTAQLLAALDETQIKAILDQHLSGLGIHNLLVIGLLPDEGDPVAGSKVILSSGFEKDWQSKVFATRQFPSGIYDFHEPAHLAILPFWVPDTFRGYLVCQAEDLDLLGALALNLASALRSSFLYRDAVRGRQMAEEADRLKSRFLSMVSHELRTLINLIIGLSEMLFRQQNHDQPLSSDRWQDIERITSNAQHLSTLINDVLDLASSEVGQLRLLLEPLDLAEVLRPVCVIGKQLSSEKGLQWSARIPSHGPWVVGDRTRLRQIGLNFISNAVKFTTLGEICFEITCQDGQVRVSVQDTGVGIPLEEQDKIFSEFWRGEKAIERDILGLGLGLAVARQLVERQNGQIGVISSGVEGKGSTFYFRMPIIETPPETISSESLSQLKIVELLSERPLLRERLEIPLQERGFDLQVYNPAADPDWLLHLTAGSCGFVILDEELVSDRGWAVLSALKRQAATEHVPMVICRLDESGQRSALVELDYLFKPLTPDQLLRELERRGLTDTAPLVLVVDDNPNIRDLHARLLREQLVRCSVLEAENGLAALEILDHNRPDLVLLDLMMPEMDGFTLLDRMRSNELTRDIPVIVLTAKVLSDEDMNHLSQGVTTILNKDMFSSSEIADQIVRMLSKDHSLGTASQRFVRKAIAFIQAHFSETITRDQIALHVNVSPDHLTDCFHKEVGLTPIAYLNRYRVNRARQLLEMGAESMTEVMLQVGFSDSAHFSRVFQRETGVPPSRYLHSRQK